MTKTEQVLDFTRVVRNRNLETSYSASDFVNPESFDSRDSSQRAWVILNAGYVQGIVFGEYKAYCEQDALDECADKGKLDGLQVTPAELKDYESGDYTDVGNPHSPDSKGWPEYEGIINLGNASEPFASESLDIWVLQASAFSEDPALMTFDRVMSRLEDIEDAAKRAYKAVDTSSPDWSALYRATCDIKDAKTLARLTAAL